MGEVVFILLENDGFEVELRAFSSEADAVAAFEDRVNELESEGWMFDFLTDNAAKIDDWTLHLIDVEVE